MNNVSEKNKKEYDINNNWQLFEDNYLVITYKVRKVRANDSENMNKLRLKPIVL